MDSVLIADVPIGESKAFRDAACAHGIHSIYIAPPNANEETMKAIAENGSGYTYLVSRAGVTGAETKAGKPIGDLLEGLKNTMPLAHFSALVFLNRHRLGKPYNLAQQALSPALPW